MKFSIVSALMAAIAVAAPGATADNYGVDSYDSELSSSYDMYPQDSASSEDWMDSEDEIVDNNNMFIALDYSRSECEGRGPNTCDRRSACVWTCKSRNNRDGCCQFRDRSPSRPSPPSSPSRPSRPSSPSSSGGSFDDGLIDGRREAERIWRDLGRSCSSAWSEFRDSVSRRIRNNGWNSNGNWRTSSFNRGARAGMNEVVAERETECFRDSSDECDELGTEAARMLAYDQCSRSSRMGTMRNNNTRRWRRICRDEAVTQCRRRISRSLNNECGTSSSSVVRNLQNKCRNKVLTMIGDRFDFEEEE